MAAGNPLPLSINHQPSTINHQPLPMATLQISPTTTAAENQRARLRADLANSGPVARAIRSIRVCAHINLRQARQFRAAGNSRMAAYHLSIALQSRRDANALR